MGGRRGDGMLSDGGKGGSLVWGMGGGRGRWYVDRLGSVVLSFNSGLLVVGRRERVLGDGIVAVWVRVGRWRVRRDR